MDLRLKVLKESNNTKFDSYSVRNSVLIISHITFRDCRVHIFSHNLSRNSCILKRIVQIGLGIVEKRCRLLPGQIFREACLYLYKNV